MIASFRVVERAQNCVNVQLQWATMATCSQVPGNGALCHRMSMVIEGFRNHKNRQHNGLGQADILGFITKFISSRKLILVKPQHCLSCQVLGRKIDPNIFNKVLT